jgi:hypothetical protein
VCVRVRVRGLCNCGLSPGFSGSLHCPVAREFCKQETLTGIKYPETHVWLEWLFWGAVVGVPGLLTVGCILCTPFRECMIRCGKKGCGAGHFTLLAPLDPRSRLQVIKTTIEMAGEKHRNLQHLVKGTCMCGERHMLARSRCPLCVALGPAALTRFQAQDRLIHAEMACHSAFHGRACHSL